MKSISNSSHAKANQRTVKGVKGMSPLKTRLFIFMALIRLGDTITDISGSVGGTTYAKNRGGNYKKNKPMPINSNTAAQQAVRNSFGTLSQAWRHMPDEQRLSFKVNAPAYPYLDRFGIPHTPSAFQLFKTLNGVLYAAGLAIVNYCLPPSFISVNPFTYDRAPEGGPLEVTFADDIYPNTAVVVEGTRQYSAGVTNTNGMFKVVAILPAGTLDTAAITAVQDGYTAIYGNIAPVGNKITLRSRTIDTLTGNVSPWVYQTQIIDV